jgi:F-box and WD-40 domain protein CDC4
LSSTHELTSISLYTDFKTGAYIRELAEPCDAVWRVTFRDDKHVVLCRREGKTLMDVRTFRPSETELG